VFTNPVDRAIKMPPSSNSGRKDGKKPVGATLWGPLAARNAVKKGGGAGIQHMSEGDPRSGSISLC